MMKLIRLDIALVLCFLMGVACQAQAHQQKQAISTILFNERTGNIEIAHRFYIHDAEHAVKRIVNGPADLMKDKDVQTAFATYVTKHFAIKTTEEKVLSLKHLGQEVKGKFFWVYQEVSVPDTLKQFEIHYDALMEIWPSQRNIVNIEGVGDIKSIELTSSQPNKVIKL
ncbi:DUF6702 family protein [Pleionea sp. CnH1-48]|uniref:DUF6702 family protein n=1 Tax=Pleionea sp. CnH1-48 TaxID=2954494 RepID=UPI0020971B56|nr:DUF6702 family protein [Pleionea sp. CnH1-48]MCO7224363.1 hypothetical protein [Pleionea sp. CnH1-48]